MSYTKQCPLCKQPYDASLWKECPEHTRMAITPIEFADMLVEAKSYDRKVPNSVILRGLQDEDVTVRNVAGILAKRRNIQIVESK